MGRLTKNGFEYYKTFDFWEPVEAALIVCGIDPCGVNYENIPDEVWGVFANAAVDYNLEHFFEHLLLLPEKKITDPDLIETYRKCCLKFCKDVDRFNTIKLKCFHPPFYLSIIKNFHDVDPLLEIVSDPNSRLKYRWATEPDCDEKKPTSEFIIHSAYAFNEGEDSEKILQIYEEMKDEFLWTLDEAILLLGCPLYVHKDWKNYEYDGYESSLGSSLCRKFSKAIDGQIFPDLGTDNKKTKQGWRDDYGCRYVNPFEFLEFVKKYDLFSIPPALEWEKITLESGEFQYQWKSELNKDDILGNSDIISEDLEKKDFENTPIPDGQQDSFEQPSPPTIIYQSTDPEKIVEEILIKIIPDIDKFYNALKTVAQENKYDPEKQLDYPTFADTAFENTKPFQYLEKNDLKGVFKPFKSQRDCENPETLPRKKGALAKKIIHRVAPEISTFASNAEKLKQKMNNLKKCR